MQSPIPKEDIRPYEFLNPLLSFLTYSAPSMLSEHSLLLTSAYSLLLMPEKIKSPTAIAMIPNIPPAPITSSASGKISARIGDTTLKMQSAIPKGVRIAMVLFMLRYSLTLSIESIGLSSTGFSVTASEIPSESASSSRLPNSEITIPTASFSVLPSAISSSYLSSIIWRSSDLALLTASVFGRFRNILSR